MNPLALLRSAPYAIIAALIAALLWSSHLYLEKRDQLSALTASVQSLGQSAEKIVKEKEQEGIDNLTTVKATYEKNAKRAASDAVANYRMRHPNSGSCPLPGNGPGERVDDGTKQKPIPDDATIAECGSDARKVAAFQLYCTLNRCPVKD